MIIVYIDILLLVILLSLTIFACGYCFYRVHQMRQSGQVAILLRPTRVLFATKRPETGAEELRTVVAYQNPFTGDYCVHNSTKSRGYMNHLAEYPYSSPEDHYHKYTPHLPPEDIQLNKYPPVRYNESVSSERRIPDGSEYLQSVKSYGQGSSKQYLDRSSTTLDDYRTHMQITKYARRLDNQSGPSSSLSEHARVNSQSRTSSDPVDQSERFELDLKKYGGSVRSPGQSVDSGLSDEYEPLHDTSGVNNEQQAVNKNALDKGWNWNYKEYQI